MKFRVLVWRFAPLIAVFSCRDEITAPASRTAVPLAPRTAAVVGGFSPQVSVGGFHICTADTGGAVRCWGRDNAGQTNVPTDLPAVSQISSGNFYTCAVTTDGGLVCWGENNFGQATPPAGLGPVSQVATATYHTCALKTDRTVACWGLEDAPVNVPAGLNSVAHVSTAPDHNCVLKTDGTAACWGSNGFSQSTIPSDLTSLSQVTVGERYTCVLTTAGEMRCWGNNELGQTNVPADIGPVAQISASYSHTCALRTNGTVACWGENGRGQASVPADLTSVLQVSAGQFNTCALKTDGTVVCWGYNGGGQNDVPAGLDLITGESQTITFTSFPPSPAVVGASYTVSATGGGSGNAVTFSIPATGSVCSLSGTTVTLLSVGSCTIAANQAGNAEYLAAPQVTQTFAVTAVQEIEFTSSPPLPAVVGTTATLSATGGGSGNPVTFSSLSESVCTVSGSTTTLIQAGTCTVAADQSGGNGYLEADQTTLSFVVIAPLAQSISFTSLPPSPALVGHSYTIAASGGASGNPVFFNSLTPTVCLVLGNTVNFVRIGTCRISADQNGNTLYLPAAQQQQIFDINDVQAIAFTSAPPSPAVVGNTYSVSATGGLSGNPVTFSSLTTDVCVVDGSRVTLRHAGSCSVAADQAAGAGYLAAQQRVQTFTVIAPIPQIVTFTSTPPATPIVGGTYSLTATGGGSGNAVLFSSSTPSVCFVIGSTVNLIARGTCTIAADQDGNAVYLPAVQKTQTFDIFDVQAISFTSTPPAPGIVGATYTVSAVGGLSGNSVTFSSLSASVCSVSGHTVSLAAAGACVVAADQAAGGGYLAAPRVTQSFTVIQPLPQAIVFTSTPPRKGIVGDTYTVTANGGGSGNPILFSSSPAAVCSMVGSTVTFRSIGTCYVTANQEGNTHYFAAPQQQQEFDIYDVQSIAFTSSPPAPGIVGGSYLVAATGGLSGHAVTFSSLSPSVCQVSGNAASLIAAGTCTVAANQAEGNGYLAAPQQTQSFTVIQPQPQSISFTSSAPSPGIVGGSYEVTGTGGASGNAVVFTSLTPGVCSVSGSSVGLNARGTCTIAANQAGNTFYQPAGQVTQAFDIYDVQSINFTSAPPNPAVVGDRYTLSASGGASGNPVTFTSLSTSTCTIGGATATFTSPGTCIIAADQTAGNGYLAATRQIQSFAVVDGQLIAFTSTPPNPAVVGGSYSVSASGGASGNPVLFSSLTPSVCFVLGNTVSLTARGTCRVAADQSGNASYLPAAQRVQVFDIYDVQSIAFTSSPPAPGIVGSSYLLAATGGLSGNAVAFSSLSPSVCDVSGNSASLIAAGTCTIAADQQAGNGYLAAPQQTQSFTVIQPVVQTIEFTSSAPSPAIVGAAYSVSASGGASGNPVHFSSLSPTVCSVTGATVRLDARGSCVIAADQAGNTFYLPATQTVQTFDVYDVQTINFTSTAPGPGIVGGSYAISATGGASGNPVTFRSLSTSVCSVTDATASFTSPGTCVIAADQAAGNGYLAAPRQTQNFAVAATQSITFTSVPPNPAIVGGSYSVGASGGASGNPVLFSSLTPSVCFVLGNTVSLNARGTCRVAADQSGGTFYLTAAQQVQVFDISELQAITFTSTPPNPAVVGNSYALGATGGLSGNPVRFSSLSTSVCTVTGNTASLVGGGTCTIAADQSEGGGYQAAPRQTQVFTVIQPIAQTISFTSTPPNTPVVGGAYTVSANGGGSGRPVVFSSLTPGTCAVTGAMVSFIAAGNCTIAANQAGDAVYLPASQATQSMVVDTRPIANAGSAQSGNEGTAVTFNAGASSDADGDAITSYNWNFGDGTSQSVSTPTVQHVYSDNGSYVVTLSVTDSRGATSASATTSASIANIAPTATFAPGSPKPEGPMTLSLTLASDAAGDLPTLQYAFDCGDGLGFSAFASSPSFSCYGPDNGTLTVRAQVKDKDGATNQYTAAISLVNVAPTVTMISAPATGSVGVDYTIQYRFTDPGTRDSPWYYQPNWGDGKKLGLNSAFTQGQTITQKYRYTAPGTYTVVVKVIDKDGQSGSASFQVTIR